MKRLYLFPLIAIFALNILSQEPANNLRKTVQELRLKFPDLKTWGGQGEIINYKSKEANVLFETKDGKVISEYTTYEGDDGFLQMWYNSLIESFSKNARHFLWGTNKNSISFFYSYFNIYISYHPNESVTISYSLNP